jgi:hypothetical protein
VDQSAERRELVGLADRVHGDEAGIDRAGDVSDCLLAASKKCGFWLSETTSREKEIELKEKK